MELAPTTAFVMVAIPPQTMTVSTRREPVMYSAPIVEAWVRRLARASLPDEAKIILKLAYTRPKLIAAVMERRKLQMANRNKMIQQIQNRANMRACRAADKASSRQPPPRSRKAKIAQAPILAQKDAG